MTNCFDVRKSNIAKGIAILILLTHHIYYNYVFGGDVSEMTFLLPKLTYAMTYYGSFVIFIFATISGFGIAAHMKKLENNISKCIAIREIGLLGTFIPVYLFSATLCVLFNESTSIVRSVYGEKLVNVAVGALFDMLGLADMFGLPKLNPTWWYMGAAHWIIVFVPILIFVSTKIRSKMAVLLTGIIFVGCNQGAVSITYMSCVLSGYIGACMYESKIIERISAFFGKVKFGRVYEIVIISCLTYIVALIAEMRIFNWYFLCALFYHFYSWW